MKMLGEEGEGERGKDLKRFQFYSFTTHQIIRDEKPMEANWRVSFLLHRSLSSLFPACSLFGHVSVSFVRTYFKIIFFSTSFTSCWKTHFVQPHILDGFISTKFQFRYMEYPTIQCSVQFRLLKKSHFEWEMRNKRTKYTLFMQELSIYKCKSAEWIAYN